MTEFVKYTQDERGVAWISLNRPDRHNAFDDAIIASLIELFTALAEDQSVRCLVLAAEGKSFSAGADLNWMKRMAQLDYQGNLADARQLAHMLELLDTLPVPVIARVQGAAFGGAVGLVSCCDIAIASHRAAFSLSEVKIGLVPATISPFVIAAMGARAARRYMLTGERFSAIQAQQLGLVSEVVEDQQLDATVDKMVDQLLANGPKAVQAAKRLVADVAASNRDEALTDMTCELIARLRVSEEGQQGLGAFLSKSSPAWRKHV